MKTWQKVVLGIGAAIALLLGVIFWLTSGLIDSGDDFFAAVQNDDYDSAYAMLSDDFQAGTSKEELKAYLAANALDDPKDVSWGGRMMTGGVAELEGTVTTRGGSLIPLKLRLIESESGWRINAIEKESSGFKDSSAGGSADTRTAPSPEKQRQLFRETMSVYAQSLSEKSMKRLRDHSSGLMQGQFTLEKFDELFGANFKFAEDYTRISQLAPVFDHAGFDDSGFFLIRAHYPIQPKPLHVRQSYVYEGIGWKSAGLVMRVGQPPS